MPRVNKTKLGFFINKLYRAEIRRLKYGTKKKRGRLTPSSPQGMKVVIDYNRKCAVCSKKYDDDPGDFQIHHINGDRSNTITSNLVLLCLSHHKRIHDLAKAKVADYKFRNKIKTLKPKREPPKPKMVTVRDISQQMFNYTAHVEPVITTTPIVIKFINWLKELIIIPDAKKENIENLFGFLQDADFTTGDTPPDDIDSLRLFRNWFYKYFRNNRKIEYPRYLRISDNFVNIDKHLCSIGGPVDQKFARYGMCYRSDGREWDPILPFIYPLENAAFKTNSEERGATILRKWKGNVWEEINWYIADRDGKSMFIPGTDRNGILNKDYMMLIVAPNTFTDISFNQSQKHLMIAPAHGLAQLAIKKILDNDKILELLARKRQTYEYFQAIIEVPGTLTRNGYVPSGKFPLVRVKPLELYEFEKRTRYKEWIKGP